MRCFYRKTHWPLDSERSGGTIRFYEAACLRACPRAGLVDNVMIISNLEHAF